MEVFSDSILSETTKQNYMKIKRIKVEGLFHIFTHELIFNENVTIIMGENGVGKTVTLNLIDAIFNARFDILMGIDFSKITVTFLHETWIIERSVKTKDNDDLTYLVITTSKKGTSSFKIDSEMLLPRLPSYLQRIDSNTWYNIRTNSYYNNHTVYERYGMYAKKKEYVIPSWYRNQMDKNRVKMIRTQRLISSVNTGEGQSFLTVNVYSNDLAKQIQDEISIAGLYGADLDRSFPVRLMKHMKGHKNYSSSEIFNDLRELEVYRHQLSGVGLLSETEQNTFDDELTSALDKLNETMLSVMHLYVKDSWEKLRKYDSIYKKLSVLNDIINTRFKHKRFSIDSRKGFVFQPEEELSKEIPLEKLSSGEQNELVLFYELLFKCDSKDLILIDEPEISLHLTWLQAMIGDFKRITKENGASLLIATHSPDFIGDNYELVQNLG